MAYDFEVENYGKSNRALSIFSRLSAGKVIVKKEEADRYGVSEKSIQRDLDEIRTFLEGQTAEDGIPNELIYDRFQKGYRLKQSDHLRLSNAEILAVSKILLDSRAFTKKEMGSLLDRLVENCVPKHNQQLVNDLLKNEKYHYIQLKHGQDVTDDFWRLGMAIQERKVIEFDYKGYLGHSYKHRRVEPQAIMFSDYYFYLVGFIENIDKKTTFSDPDDMNPTIYRVDRIKNLEVTEDKYSIPYKNRFEEGEFRKRIQFMYGGRLRRVKFRYVGPSIEAIEDRLPTAEVTKEEDGSYIVEAEVYGDGIDMWLRSQGKYVELL